MRKKWNPKRRRFLEAAVGVAAAGSAASCSRSDSPWRCLTALEAETAASICDCFIPDDEFPGAASAGAVDFIDRQLTGHLRRHRRAYHAGLDAVNRTSLEKYGELFARLGAERQVDMLKAMEQGQAPGVAWKGIGQREFFALILSHTMQSYYGDPRHGGNRESVGYRMLGIPITPVRGQQKNDLADVKPAGGVPS